LAGTQLFGEVYALFVNENSASFTENPLKLSQQTVQQILTHKIRNWNLVTDVAGNSVASGSIPITIVNREKGSGSRTATDLLIAGDSCTTGGGILFDAAGATDFFSTGDVLSNASGTPGAITYATIDQSASNMVQVWLNGVQPTNLNAASGAYPFWVEAEFVVNGASTADVNVVNFITAALQTEATAPHVADVLAIPGVPSGAGNVAHAVINNSISTVPALGAASIYVNPFTRGGVTCSAPTYVATQQ
jgi:ABC-type phosphate transport system substrate-binding protein